MGKQTIQELKACAKTFKCVTPWDEVEENVTYHLPPLATLERRDITILDKDDEKATYRKIGDKTKTDHTLHKSSVFARFIVKRKTF